jgi:DNA mismatch repair protein MSH6
MDDEPLSNFRTLICQIRPVEVLVERELMSSEVVKMLRNTPIVPVFTPLMPKDCWGVIKTCSKLDTYFSLAKRDWPESLTSLKSSADQGQLALESLGMAMAFLESALISEMTLTTGDFQLYTPETQSQLEYMVLDSQALQHLEIVETASGKVEGSLFHFLDNCRTAFGKRLLKRWLLSPLMNVTKLNQRLDAVEDLISHQFETDVLRTKLSRLPDLEKLLAKLYTYSVKHKVKAIYFENVSLGKLKEFRAVLRHFKALPELISSLREKQFKSARLRELMAVDHTELMESIAEFEGMIVWKRTQGGDEEVPEPQPGLDEGFDTCNQAVDEVKSRLERILAGARQRFRDSRRINWSNAKYRYELEIP